MGTLLYEQMYEYKACMFESFLRVVPVFRLGLRSLSSQWEQSKSDIN